MQPGIWELVVFRFLQGLGGGALLVTSQTIITESWPAEKRAMAQAIYTLGVIVGPTLGPPLGGYIVDNFNWRYIFYINIPVGVIATLLTLQFVTKPALCGEKNAEPGGLAGYCFTYRRYFFATICVGKRPGR